MDQKGDAQTGANATPGSKLPKTGPETITPPVVVAAGGSKSGATRSGIGAGLIEIPNEARQRERTGQSAEETVARVNRDVSSHTDSNGAVAENFCKENFFLWKTKKHDASKNPDYFSSSVNFVGMCRHTFADYQSAV